MQYPLHSIRSASFFALPFYRWLTSGVTLYAGVYSHLFILSRAVSCSMFHPLELFKMKSRTGKNDACWEMWDQMTTLFNVACLVFFLVRKRGMRMMSKWMTFSWDNSIQLWNTLISVQNISGLSAVASPFPSHWKYSGFFLELHAWDWVCGSYVLSFGDGASLTTPGTLFPV